MVGTTTTTYAVDTAALLTLVVAETTGTATIQYLHGLGLVAQSDGASTSYLLNDGLGSVRQVLHSIAGVLMAQTFDPYGNPFVYSGPSQPLTTHGYANEYTVAKDFYTCVPSMITPLREGSSSHQVHGIEITISITESL